MTTTTQKLPIEALGDKDLVDRLSKLPKDKQPFWLLNWQALEDQRRNPQTYPQRPSHFGQPLNPNFMGSISPSSVNPSTTIGPGFTSDNRFSSGATGSNSGNTGIASSGFSNGNTNFANDNFGFTNTATANSGATTFDSAPRKPNPVNVIPVSTTASGLGNRFGVANSVITRPTGQILTPTYPIYAHIDDALSNKYVPSDTSKSTRFMDDSGATHTDSTNQPANENSKLFLPDSTKFVNADFFYLPSLSEFKHSFMTKYPSLFRSPNF